jgi:DNA-binding MarR family transcriptional regulator
MQNKIVDEIRSFNRFYTGVLGLLDKYLHQSIYTLPEVRILFELYHNQNVTASELINSLHVDKGYLSRILRSFEKKKLVTRKKNGLDNRIVFVELTAYGKSEFEILNTASQKHVETMITPLSTKERETLIKSMTTIKKLLST